MTILVVVIWPILHIGEGGCDVTNAEKNKKNFLMCYIFLTGFNSFHYPKKRSEKNLNIYFLIHEKINNNINKREEEERKIIHIGMNG